MDVTVEVVPGGLDVVVDGDEYPFLWSECSASELTMAQDDIGEYLDALYATNDFGEDDYGDQ